MRALLVAAAMLCMAAGVAAQGKEPDKALGPVAHQQAGELEAAVFLTNNPKGLKEALAKGPGEVVKLTIDKVRFAEALHVAVVFAGCKPGKEGNCKLTAAVEVHMPNGRRVNAGQALVWDATPPSTNSLQLAREGIQMSIDKPDPPGRYVVATTVRDEVSKKSVALRTAFTVQP